MTYLEKRYPNADPEVLQFIDDFVTHESTLSDDESTIIQRLFSNGYCYHFAIILKNIFNRGEIC